MKLKLNGFAIGGSLMTILFFIAVVVFLFTIALLLTQWAWGLFMVPVFGLKILTMWEAVGLLFLANIMTGFKYNKSND